MSQTPPPPIVASTAVPDRANRATFSALATGWANWLKDHAVPEIAAVAVNVFNNALEAWSSAVASAASALAAATSESNAAASAEAAALAASAPAWVSGNAYALLFCVVSNIDFQTYRKITPTSISLLDPAADNLGDWVQLGAVERIGDILYLADNYSVL